MSASPPYIFISYASADRERVLPVVQALEGAGVRAWLDQAAIPGGTVYGPEIVDGIEGCVAFVILCSALSLASPNVRQEIALAWKYRKPYLPLLLEPVSIPRDVEYWLEGAQWVEVLDKPERLWLPSVMQALSRLAPELASAPRPPAAPVPTVEQVEKQAVEAARPQLPPLVGREAELAVLRSLLEFASAGHGQVAFLVGEPGIGKTRLTSELVAQAQASGWRACWSYCHEWEGAPPYWPWKELLRAALDDLDSAALHAALGAGGADLAQIIPELRMRLPDLPVLPPMEPEQARFRLFESVAGVLKSLARTQRLILVLDDLHWADAASVALLQFVVNPLRTLPLAIVGTYRNVEVSQQRPLAAALAAILREPHATRLLLHGLTEEEAARYVRELAGGDPPAATLAAIYRETEGNPFFVGEITRLLLDEGTLWQRDTAALRIRVPESVREVIGRRLERLSDECHELLRVASVIGRDFSLQLLETLGSQDTDALLDLLDEALASQLVVEGAGFGQYRFSHALVQETLYEELGTARRVRLHGQVGDALERVHAADATPYLGELAQHYFQSAPSGYVDKALDYAARAAEQAMTQLAWEVAIGHYQRALQALDLKQPVDQVQKCELLLALGSAQLRAAIGTESALARVSFRAAAAIARNRGEPERFTRAALGFAGYEPNNTEGGTEQLELLREALLQLPKDDSALRAKLLARTANDMFWVVPASAAEAMALSDEAIAVARRIGDPATLAQTLVLRYSLCWTPDNAEERLDLSKEIVTVAAEAGDMMLAGWGYCDQWEALIDLGRFSDIPPIDAALAEIHRRLPISIWEYIRALLQGGLALVTGRFADAEVWVERYHVIWPTNSAHYSAGWFALGHERGNLAEVREQFIAKFSNRIADESSLEKDFTHTGWTTFARAMFLALDAETGHPEQARIAFDGFWDGDALSLARDWSWSGVVAILAETAVLLEDMTRAASLYGQLLPYAGLNLTAGHYIVSFGPGAYFLGLLATLLGRWDAAEQHFTMAIATSEHWGAPPFSIRARYAYADMLAKRGEPNDRERALGLLHMALAGAEEIGMARLAEQVRALQALITERRPHV